MFNQQTRLKVQLGLMDPFRAHVWSLTRAGYQHHGEDTLRSNCLGRLLGSDCLDQTAWVNMCLLDIVGKVAASGCKHSCQWPESRIDHEGNL